VCGAVPEVVDATEEPAVTGWPALVLVDAAASLDGALVKMGFDPATTAARASS
jgi:hypothetical protein